LRDNVSVLFSEPKIPQSIPTENDITANKSFSALQRAENSSIPEHGCDFSVFSQVSVLFSEPKIPQSQFWLPKILMLLTFQCSSASRKFLNPAARICDLPAPVRFSALQRAENSSIDVRLLAAIN